MGGCALICHEEPSEEERKPIENVNIESLKIPKEFHRQNKLSSFGGRSRRRNRRKKSSLNKSSSNKSTLISQKTLKDVSISVKEFFLRFVETKIDKINPKNLLQVVNFGEYKEINDEVNFPYPKITCIGAQALKRLIFLLENEPGEIGVESFNNYHERIRVNLDDKNDGLVCWSLIFYNFIIEKETENLYGRGFSNSKLLRLSQIFEWTFMNSLENLCIRGTSVKYWMSKIFVTILVKSSFLADEILFYKEEKVIELIATFFEFEEEEKWSWMFNSLIKEILETVYEKLSVETVKMLYELIKSKVKLLEQKKPRNNESIEYFRSTLDLFRPINSFEPVESTEKIEEILKYSIEKLVYNISSTKECIYNYMRKKILQIETVGATSMAVLIEKLDENECSEKKVREIKSKRTLLQKLKLNLVSEFRDIQLFSIPLIFRLYNSEDLLKINYEDKSQVVKFLPPFLNDNSLHIKFLVSSLLEKAFMNNFSGFLGVFDQEVLIRILEIAVENYRPKYINIELEIFWNILANDSNEVSIGSRSQIGLENVERVLNNVEFAIEKSRLIEEYRKEIPKYKRLRRAILSNLRN